MRPETSGVRHDTSISYKKLSSEKNVYKLYTYFDYVFWSFIRTLMKMNYVILSINPLWLKIPVFIFVENLHTTFLLIRSRLIISINLWKHIIRLNMYIYRSPNVYPDDEEIDKVSHLIFKSLLYSISYVLFYFIINLCTMYKLDIFYEVIFLIWTKTSHNFLLWKKF